VKWPHIDDSEKVGSKIVNIRCGEEITEVSIEFQTLTLVSGKESWSEVRITTNSKSSTVRDEWVIEPLLKCEYLLLPLQMSSFASWNLDKNVSLHQKQYGFCECLRNVPETWREDRTYYPPQLRFVFGTIIVSYLA
jgi:hypothetical protein